MHDSALNSAFAFLGDLAAWRDAMLLFFSFSFQVSFNPFTP
jgi:hypothetical protein